MHHPTARPAIDTLTLGPEADVLARLIVQANLSEKDRTDIVAKATKLVERIRAAGSPGLMEVFLAEYGLSTDEGISLMCLAEALLRVPDAETIDALIEDKIAPSDWGRHLGHSTSSLVNASTWALMLTGRVLDDDGKPGLAKTLRGAVKRVGEPVIRAAVARAMKEMGRQFVLGEDITKAMKRASGMQAKGFTYSYDMLGEAARTEADARDYHLSYSRAISSIATHCAKGPNASVADNPGISVKLSALHPRYEVAQTARVMEELVPRLRALALLAKAAGMGLNIDAEEADRLSLSLDVIEAALSDPALKDWDGFGVVVQAYGHRAGPTIDWLYALATRLNRRIMVRLVKGAYWDAEIKRAQIEGLNGFPVFTDKVVTDVSYIANARKLLGMTDRIYPQFATHNAHTVAAVLHLAQTMGTTPAQYEFQRLHGMGELLHTLVLQGDGTRCRIYAPVGAHEDLLAYLVRRLLENGANSSFVNQIVDDEVPPAIVAADPFAASPAKGITVGPDLYRGEPGARDNSAGWDVTDVMTLQALDAERAPFKSGTWKAHPTLSAVQMSGALTPVEAPDGSGIVGHIVDATPQDVIAACDSGQPWSAPVAERANVLRWIADAYEEHAAELFALLAREAGKTLPDCVAELREAVDFLNYYAAQAEAMGENGTADDPGLWACISPWNFPLAIFTGQIAAALAAGHSVLAKPAPQTPLVAYRAIALMHAAGVPKTALRYLPGGADTGAALTAQPNLRGVSFTGSTATAQAIRRSLATHARPGTPLIAETGGLNAMIVDSTALPEHAVRDIVMSSFRSAGQRCSALRCLYVQEDIAKNLITMLTGAMDELSMGNPWDTATDIGPVIDGTAKAKISAHIALAKASGRLIHQTTPPEAGYFVAPAAIRINSIADMTEEIFGPVLHIATFKSDELEKVIADINATGYGLTFGLHTRIDDRVQTVVDLIGAGNVYVNRNQIGAVVGSQPFGGHGLSGTGPKAGGPNYLPRYLGRTGTPQSPLDMLGPTGESNRLTLHPRAPLLCCGPGADQTRAQADAVRKLGGAAVELDGLPGDLETRGDFAGVIWWGEANAARAADQALARRKGPLIPLITGQPDVGHVFEERHVCIDTTAAGGNAALLAEVSR